MSEDHLNPPGRRGLPADDEPTTWLGDVTAEPTMALGEPEPTRAFPELPGAGAAPASAPQPSPWIPAPPTPPAQPQSEPALQPYAQPPQWAAPAYGSTPQAPSVPVPPQGMPSQQGAAQPVSTPRRRGGALSTIIVSSLVAALVGGGCGYWVAQRTAPVAAPSLPSVTRAPLPPAVGQADTVKVAERVLPSTVTISAGSGAKAGTGSGFAIDDQGHIMTNNHVVESAANGGRVDIQLQDGRAFPATIVGRSPAYDLAVIKVDGADVPAVELGDSRTVRPGQQVVAVGAPLGLGGTVTAGIVSATDRPLSVGGSKGGDDSVAYINGIQIDAPINPGNSGGPLADGAGRIIGVNSAILTLGGATTDAQQGNIGLGFAIPITQAQQIGQELIARGRATVPVIGASVAAADTGVRLTQITPGGPAAKAGLATGTIVTQVEGKRVFTATDIIVRIRAHRPGETLELTLDSGQKVTVTLGSREG